MLVEDDEPMRRFLTRRYSEQVELVAFSTFEDADARLDEPWDVHIIDRRLPNGRDGLELAMKVAERRNDVPVLVFTGNFTDQARAEANRLGVLYADKADGFALVDRLVATPTRDRAALMRPTPSERVWALKRTHGLTERECEVLEVQLAGRTRVAGSRALGIEPATYRTHATNILAKTGFTRLAHLVAHLLAEN